MLRWTVFVWILGLFWVIGGAVDWQTGSVTLTSQVSAAWTPESPEVPSASTLVNPSRKLIRRPSIDPLSPPAPESPTPPISIRPTRRLIQRPSISPVSSPPPPSISAQISVNVHGSLIRRPSVGLTSATAPASTMAVPSVHSPQITSPTVNGAIPSVGPSAEATAAAKSKTSAQAAMASSTVTAPIFAPSFRSALVSAPVNPTPAASVGQLIAAPQSGTDPASYPRKLTQRPEVAAILAPPAQASSPPPPPPPPAPPATPTIGRSPTSLAFTGVQGGANPASRTLNITNTGGGTLSWNVTDNAPWLSLNPGSGTTTTETDAITVSVNTSGLTAGTYNALITATANGATNTPQTVQVTLTLTTPPGPPSSGTATLTWTASTSTDLAGYNVYVGTASGVYNPPTSVGNVTTYLVTNLQPGTTYFFTLTAVDTSNNESVHSNEVSKSIF